MTELEVVKANAPRSQPRGPIRTIVEPSEELLAILQADPTADITFAADRGALADDKGNVTTVPGYAVWSEHAANHGCPHCAAEGSGHGVMSIPVIVSVYDRCGQQSGNRIARDVARIIQITAGGRIRVYRIGTGKFAFIGPDKDTMRGVLAEINTELQAASVTVDENNEGALKGARSIEEFLERHSRPFGLKIRMRPRRRF